MSLTSRPKSLTPWMRTASRPQSRPTLGRSCGAAGIAASRREAVTYFPAWAARRMSRASEDSPRPGPGRQLHAAHRRRIAGADLPLPGRHNLANALAAAALAQRLRACRIDSIAAGIEQLQAGARAPGVERLPAVRCSSTTATTPIPAPCARPSSCSRAPRAQHPDARRDAGAGRATRALPCTRDGELARRPRHRAFYRASARRCNRRCAAFGATAQWFADRDSADRGAARAAG
jgi:hypothetical protein